MSRVTRLRALLSLQSTALGLTIVLPLYIDRGLWPVAVLAFLVEIGLLIWTFVVLQRAMFERIERECMTARQRAEIDATERDLEQLRRP